MFFPDHVRTETVSVWNGKIDIVFRVAGDGPTLVYLHPAAGLMWTPFLDALARHHTVVAPHFPGTAPDDPHAIHRIDELGDLVLIYEEALRAMNCHDAAVIGESFGGMLASELAATFPDLFSQVALLAPVGLWREDLPVANWIAAAKEEMPAMLFADPSGPAAQAMFTPPDDPEMAVKGMAGLVWSIGCTGKFLWPIPEKGLAKRLHRVTAPVLIIWGAEDRLIPAAYAEIFANHLAKAQVVIVPNAGHVLPAEAGEAVLGHLTGFLAPPEHARGAA
ncbi:MAG: alpha/beta fold hydrolase [Roseitalea sp.]|jgi:pimeloyl-ACP methyl ester carboxylesterase|nr:alpha/beta fold hydrolase [Roseitalea sp.]MBO6721374.1 alpha/beta fold hydrolase [Roseitalea sp.]MBO6744559.1 alpha/beta fold hydrolase [Roseitalea sp.]